MKFSDLQLFLQVVEAGGMTQAAARLGTSQPGISRTIRDVEMRLGVTLLRRTGRGVELTAAGERFVRFCRGAVDGFEETKKDLRALEGALPSALSIAVPRQTGRLLAPALYRNFTAAMPEVEVDIKEEISSMMCDDLRSGAADIAISYSNSYWSNISRDVVRKEVLYLIGLKKAVGSSSEPISLSEAAAMPLLMYSEPHYQRFIRGAFRRRKLTPKVIREMATHAAMLAFAVEGEGVAIASFSNIYREFERGEICARPIVSPPIERSICLSIGSHVEARFGKSALSVARKAMTDVAEHARWY
ncbi:MAG: LysR family transcriptional regulator [Pseudomonadota bacterium]